MEWRVEALVLVCVLSACAARQGPSGVAVEHDVTAADGGEEVVAESSNEEQDTRTFIVGNDDGLREVGLDGRLVRTISDTPASHPRLLASGELLFLNPRSLELRRLDLGTGEETTIATVPRHPECGDSLDVSIDIQSAADFVVDEGSGSVCLRLMDRNANMADYGIVLRLDLEEGTLHESVWLPSTCNDGDTDEDLFVCEDSAPPHHGGSPPQRAADLPEEYVEESRSPSGRWALISGEPVMGDYVWRTLFLRETSSGRLFPFNAGRWLEPIDPAAPLDAGDTVRAAGESTIRWLEGDLLQIDELLVIPGSRAIQLGGLPAH